MNRNLIYFVDDFDEVCHLNKINFHKLDGLARDLVFKHLADRFLENYRNSSSDIFLWEFLTKEAGGAHLPNSASNREFFLDLIPNVNNIYFMFEPQYLKEIYVFNNIKELVKALKESYNFNFYIFDCEFKFLICWESFETLFGSGVAKMWVEQIKEKWFSK